MDQPTLTELSLKQRQVLQTIIGDLLHDWIKYMELRLLSVDWTNPTGDPKLLLQKGICQTRASSTKPQGVELLWSAARDPLLALGLEAVDQLVEQLDQQVLDLVALLDWSNEQTRNCQKELLNRIRRPGRLLRNWLNEIA